MTKLIRRLACMVLALALGICAGYAEETPASEITVGSLTQMSGMFFTDGWGNNTADADVRALLHGYSTVDMLQYGQYGIDETVCRAYPNPDKDGNVVYTFYLNKHLTYSDGTPITARDYAFSVLLQSSPALAELGAGITGYAQIVGQDAYAAGETNAFSGVRIVNDTTFSLAVKADYLPDFHELMLVRVTPYPIHVIAPGCQVLDDGEGAYVEGGLDAEKLRETLLDPETGYCSHPSVVSGPYTLASYEDHVAVLTRNEAYRGNYQGVKPTIERITFKQVFNETLVEQLKSGEIDLVNKVSSADVMDAAAQTEGIASATYDREGLALLAFACENEPVSSANVRKAIARLVDVDALCQGYLKGRGAPVYGYYGNGQWMAEKAGQEALKALDQYPYDVDEAIALLEADGWTLEEGAQVRSRDGQELSVHWVRPETSEVADLLERMLTESFAKAGIGLTVTRMSYEDLSSAYYRQTDRSEYDLFFLGSNFGMTFNPYPAVSTEAAYQGTGNTTAIADEELEALALDMNRTRPGETKVYTEKWLAFQTRWVEVLPMVPLYSNEYADLFTQQLQNYRPDSHYSWAVAILDAYIK